MKFNSAYAEDARPKHHAAFHVPDMVARMQKYVHCEPHESKHRAYKSALAARHVQLLGNDNVWAEAILVRMNEAQTERARSSGLQTGGIYKNLRRMCVRSTVVYENSLLWIPTLSECYIVLNLVDEPELAAECELLRMVSAQASSATWIRTESVARLNLRDAVVEIPPWWFYQDGAIIALL